MADRKSAKLCVVYLTKKQTSARSPALASARIAQNLSGPAQKIYSEFPKFHPNPFTSGEVIAERVNIVETRHKVFPILGEASSPSNYAHLHRITCHVTNYLATQNMFLLLHNSVMQHIFFWICFAC